VNRRWRKETGENGDGRKKERNTTKSDRPGLIPVRKGVPYDICVKWQIMLSLIA